jgi:hypothetical protein
MDEFALLYDECFHAGGITSAQVDDLPLWEVASMLGRNRPEPREEWPTDAPDIKTVRRHLALAENRPPPPRDSPIDDAEYAKLITVARSGSRKAV